MKTLTGLAIGILEDEASLSCETFLRDILADFPAYGDSLRLKHLIHHESGLHNYTVLLYYMAGWHEQEPPSSDQIYETLCRAGSLSFQPGAKYGYCDSNYFLLARVIECVTGRRFGAFIEERILKPLGMDDSAILDHTTTIAASDWAEGYVGYPSELRSPHEYRNSDSWRGFYPARLAYSHVGAEGLRTSVSDLLTLGRHLAGPSEVLPSSVRERILVAPRMREDGFGYGYGLNVGTFRGMRFFGHSGAIQGFTATLTCLPDKGLQIACMTNRHDLAAWTCRNWVLDELLEERTVSQQTKDISGPEAAGLQELQGFYFNPGSSCFLELVNSGNRSGISLNGGPVLPLSGSGPWQTAGGIEIICSESGQEKGRPSVVVQAHDVASEYLPFSQHRELDVLTEYEGVYVCEPLDTAFRVKAMANGIRLTNEDARRPSMDLDYVPTIRDFFWSHDPHPGLSQLQFLRDADHIRAFVYRDYDGDQREDFVFARHDTI